MNPLSRLLLPLALFCIAAPLARADWPTYQHDTSRVGATTEALATPLADRWTFSSPTAPVLAWPGEEGRSFEGYVMTNRIRFDEVFHVAIANGRVFFGSSVDGRVFCKNLATGAEEWTFFTDGPIRLAPMIVDGKLFIGSDDGHAYCLDAATGKVIWNLRAGPNDERILARGRMISRWPVRTGVLVDGGTAYFGAGVFPHENVYLYAVEAATGKVIWKNDAISQDDAGRNELSPQGYLLTTKDILFVPSGRALSAAFDRKTGEQLKRTSGAWRGIGGTQAMLADDQLYAVGERQILATEQTSGKAGFGWFQGNQMTLAGDVGFFANGKEIIAVDRIKYAEGSREKYKLESAQTVLNTYLKKHPALDELKKVTAAEKDLTAAKDTLAKAGAAARTAAQTALAKAEKAFADVGKSYESKRKDYQTKKDQYAAKQKVLDAMPPVGVKWKAPLKHDSALILAGKTLIAGGQGEVVCLDVETGAQLWKKNVDGDARGLAVADGHLVVSTSAGKVYAFADTGRTALPTLASAPAVNADPFPKDDLSPMYAAAAESILKQTGIKRGFCLVAGSENGRLAYEIAKRSDLVIFGVDADARKVAAARAALAKSGLYGSRVTFDHLDLNVIPYSSYFANLIVSDTVLLTAAITRR